MPSCVRPISLLGSDRRASWYLATASSNLPCCARESPSAKRAGGIVRSIPVTSVGSVTEGGSNTGAPSGADGGGGVTEGGGGVIWRAASPVDGGGGVIWRGACGVGASGAGGA